MKTRALTAGLTLAALTNLASPAQAKNVLVIIGDDMATDKVRSYAADYPGYAPAYLPNTKAIDSLAAAGIRFTRAWATPLCTPTRASFQTGVFPFRHGQGTAIGDSAPGVDTAARLMLAQSFSNQGYKTGLFGKYHIGVGAGAPTVSPFFTAPHPSLAGWDRFFGILGGYPGPGRSFTNWPKVSWFSPGIGFLADETLNMTDRTSTVARNWINLQTGDWLAVVSFSAPHSPDTSSSDWQYGDADVTRYRTPALSCLATASCGDEARSVYQALTEHVDLEIEDLLNGIDPAVMENTLIVFFGDNGTPHKVQEGVFDTANRGKGSVYENGIRVPMIVADGVTWLKGTAGAIVTPGRIVEAGVNTMDLFQTVHNHALALSVAGVDATSFTDCFTTTDVYCGRVGRQYGYSETFVANGSISSAKIAVRYGNDKMVAAYDNAPTRQCLGDPDVSGGPPTFYDTATDPLELAPQAWTGVRADRLRDYFTNLHAPDPASWAWANGPLVGFCP
jgi:arylsulfatase A-like enzyme